MNSVVQWTADAAGHSVYVNLKTRKASTVPRHNEINDFLVRKICRDLEVPCPSG
jgi:mRNA interferase HicA